MDQTLGFYCRARRTAMKGLEPALQSIAVGYKPQGLESLSSPVGAKTLPDVPQ